MDALPQLLPLGGASALLVILLRAILHMQSQWATERATLIAEHRGELAEQEARHAVARADYERHITMLRDRIESLEDEVKLVRQKLNTIGGPP